RSLTGMLLSDLARTTRVTATAAPSYFFFFFFNDTAPPEIYTLSLHDALPILSSPPDFQRLIRMSPWSAFWRPRESRQEDRKSTRLNSSQVRISHPVFFFK